jgi:CDGSH iron-sulfur domain-containing protein 3
MTEPESLPVVTITPRDNGPYKVTGPVVLEDVDGGRWPVEAGKAVWLCRCGQSANKPFCDSTHKRIGFSCVVRAPAPVEASGN